MSGAAQFGGATGVISVVPVGSFLHPTHMPPAMGLTGAAFVASVSASREVVPAGGPELVGEVPAGTPGAPEAGLRAYAVATYEPDKLGDSAFDLHIRSEVLLRSPGPDGRDDAHPVRDCQGHDAATRPARELRRLLEEVPLGPAVRPVGDGGPGLPPGSEEAVDLVRRAGRRALVLRGAVQLLGLSEHLSPLEVRECLAMAAVLEVMRR